MVWTFKQEWFELAPRLRVLSTPSAGRDYFLVEPPPQVRLMYGAFHGCIIAETVVGMILAMTRGLLASATTLADQPWPRQELCSIIRPLRGSHVVILGLGNVGEWIGRMLKPFGVRISGLRRSLHRKPPAWFTPDDRLFLEDDLDAVLQTADHVVLALPGNEDTNGILNSRRINLLASHVTICNVGRGNAIEEMPLYAALSAGRIAGAFLDVFSTEPLPENSILRRCPNLWRLPHASAISEQYLDLYVEDFAQQWKEWAGMP
ncbi:MAG TPA: NAD(P)-dependent oxidoreductase [Lentisphaeria bacterium]|nr:NAD(P)-dependent oxidoreductase [Lentisphaeria bacterium]HQC51824.1 NAD(P)-dependent oxidoreductase [Lentisphaeria bacterium]